MGALEVGNHRLCHSRGSKEGATGAGAAENGIFEVKKECHMSSDQLTLIICCFFLGIRLPIYQKIIIASIGTPLNKPVQWNVTRV